MLNDLFSILHEAGFVLFFATDFNATLYTISCLSDKMENDVVIIIKVAAEFIAEVVTSY